VADQKADEDVCESLNITIKELGEMNLGRKLAKEEIKGIKEKAILL
jgi:hypothetical protein